MAQTVQRGAASGSKRKTPATSSDPPTPAAKKAKTATARKSTGGRPPRRSNVAEQSTSAAGRILSAPRFVHPLIVTVMIISPKKTTTIPSGDSGSAGNSKVSEEY
jgi:hypothetical protein